MLPPTLVAEGNIKAEAVIIESMCGILALPCCVGKQRTKRRETISIYLSISFVQSPFLFIFSSSSFAFLDARLLVWMERKRSSRIITEKRAHICGVLEYINLTVYDLITFSSTGVGWFLWLLSSHRSFRFRFRAINHRREKLLIRSLRIMNVEFLCRLITDLKLIWRLL